MLEDGTMGADHRLNAGNPVNRPEKEKQTWWGEGGGDRQLKLNIKEEKKKITLWFLYTEPCSQDLKKKTRKEPSLECEAVMLALPTRRAKPPGCLEARRRAVSLPV